MTNQNKIRVGSLRFVVESTPNNIARSEKFVRQAFTIALQGLQNANVGFAIYDENDVRERTILFEKLGKASDEMTRTMQFEFGSDDDPEEAAVG